jgi:hypothetical protein
VFVAGLARSGTTVLLEFLAKAHGAVSHRYRDFPFVHCPILWNRFLDKAQSRTPAPRERAHQDRLMVTPESPEAMDEILWMTFFPHIHDPSRSQVLARADCNEEFDAFYRDHIRKLLWLRGGSRFVCKGNYLVTRLAYLARVFPDVRFVIAVREPAAHIASLTKQHELFRRLAQRDPRTVAYLQRSGHFEFGIDRRPIHTGDTASVNDVLRRWNCGDEVAGWARYWSMVYACIRDTLAEESICQRTVTVRYEDLCADPEATLRRIADHCRLEYAGDTLERFAAAVSAPAYYAPKFTDRERSTITELTSAVAAHFGYLTK